MAMDSVHHPADAQFAAGALPRQLQSDGHSHNPVHHHSTGGDPSPHGAADTPNAGYEQPTASFEGDTDPLRQGPRQNIPGNYESVPGGGRQSSRMLGAADHPNAHPHRLVPRSGADSIRIARRPRGTVGEDISLRTLLIHLRRRPVGIGLLMVRLGQIGPHQRGNAGPGVCFHLGPAEDDHDAGGGPASARQSNHDAVDDAAADRLLFFYLPQWAGPLLDNIQCHRHRHTILHNRVATLVPAVPKSRTRGRTNSAGTGSGAQGDS